MIESALAGPHADQVSDNTRRGPERVPLRLTGRLAAGVHHTIERRLALLDEFETLREHRVELARSAQLVGGQDNGDRPVELGIGRDPRHRLSSALATIAKLEREFDTMKRDVNEADR